jgi:hypothetical protein
MHGRVRACSRSMAQQTTTTVVGLELDSDTGLDGTIDFDGQRSRHSDSARDRIATNSIMSVARRWLVLFSQRRSTLPFASATYAWWDSAARAFPSAVVWVSRNPRYIERSPSQRLRKCRCGPWRWIIESSTNSGLSRHPRHNF